MNRLLLLFWCTALALSTFSQTRLEHKGNYLFSSFKYKNALKNYLKAIDQNPADSVLLQEKIADCYTALNNYFLAEQWYKKAINNGSYKSEVWFLFIQTLCKNNNYGEAEKYLLLYKARFPNDLSADKLLTDLNNIKEISRYSPAFSIDENSLLSTYNSGVIQTYLNDSIILFSTPQKPLSIDWKNRSFNHLKTTADFSSVRAEKTIKAKGFKSINSLSFSADRNEIVFAASKIQNTLNGKEIHTQLFSTPYPAKSKNAIKGLPFNEDNSSNAHPALSSDGNTLFFVSDRAGGFGGSDIYMVKRENEQWGIPQNLGSEINSAHDEIYPFIASDSVLYFSSNGHGGLGAQDVFRTTFKDEKWSKPENVGAPINSNFDDFAFKLNRSNQKGFFTSTRNTNQNQIFQFDFDASKLSYKVLLKVVDKKTKQAISNATASINGQKFQANDLGEIRLIIKNQAKQTIKINAKQYKSFEQMITRKNAGTIDIALIPDMVLLNVFIREKETGLPMRDVTVSLKDEDQNIVTFVTDDTGVFSTPILKGTYLLFSNDYDSLIDKFSTAQAVNEELQKEYRLSKNDFTVSLPLMANCFSSKVTITNLKTNETSVVIPDLNGEVRLDLKLNQQYMIEHNLRKDTISTEGFFPGDEIEGPCKFTVGQKWILNNIFYDYDKIQIRPDAVQQLDNLVRIMNEHPSLQIQLASYTDCRGSIKYNDLLSLNRAKAAIDYLVSKGIKIKRLVAAGFGKRKPLNDCNCEPEKENSCTDAQHQANRRTEVKVLKY